MATITRFEDLAIWQKARILCRDINKYVLKNHKSTNSFRDQIDRSSGSVMDNIAEGFEREGNLEFRQFLTIAKGSCGEVRSQLYRATDREIITHDISDNLINQTEVISKMISGMIKYLNKSDLKGNKYKVSEEEVFYIPEDWYIRT